MKITLKHILIALAVIAVLVVAYLMYKKRKAQKEQALLTDPLSSSTQTGTTSVFPLKEGSKGKEVKQLQSYLLKEFGAKTSNTGVIDGVWGPMTTSAVSAKLNRTSISEDFFKKAGMDKIVVA